MLKPIVCPEINTDKQEVTDHYWAGYNTVPEFEFLKDHNWLYTLDLSYDHEKWIDIESPVSCTRNIHGVFDLFCRIGGVNRDLLEWVSIVERDPKGLKKYHHHLLIGKNGLDASSVLQMTLLRLCWEQLYREKWYDDWKQVNRLTSNRVKNKILRHRYNDFWKNLDAYLGIDHKSPPKAFNIMGENLFIDRKFRKIPFNGMGSAHIQLYDKEKFSTNGVGYRLKRPTDPYTGKPVVKHPVVPDMSPMLKRRYLKKREHIIAKIDQEQKFFTKKDPGQLHPFKLFNIIPDHPGFDLRLIGLSGGKYVYYL